MCLYQVPRDLNKLSAEMNFHFTSYRTKFCVRGILRPSFDSPFAFSHTGTRSSCIRGRVRVLAHAHLSDWPPPEAACCYCQAFSSSSSSGHLLQTLLVQTMQTCARLQSERSDSRRSESAKQRVACLQPKDSLSAACLQPERLNAKWKWLEKICWNA